MTTRDVDPIEMLRALLSEATPGPWTIEREELSVDFDDEEQETAYPRCIGPWDVEHESVDVATVEADARLIAALRNLAPRLLAVAEAARTLADGTADYDEHEFRDAALREALDALRADAAEVL